MHDETDTSPKRQGVCFQIIRPPRVERLYSFTTQGKCENENMSNFLDVKFC